MDNIITRTTAYKIFASDKKADMLSHAYLIVCSDGAKLRDYIKIFVKTALCSSDGYCDDCRICKLIDKEEAIDVSFYPKKNQEKSPDKILTADADEIVSAWYMKPLEC